MYSAHIKSEIARVAMETKAKLIAPTPRRVRARLPNLTMNPNTGKPMDKKTIHAIYKTKCYDEREDDPWQYLHNAAQDVIPAELLQQRVRSARHILDVFNAGSWYHFVAIDPCYSLLAKHPEKKFEQMVHAMGSKKWRSENAPRIGPNGRAPAVTKTQQGSWVTRVDWTVVFARDKLRIFVVDDREAERNANYPSSLPDSVNLGKFVEHVYYPASWRK